MLNTGDTVKGRYSIVRTIGGGAYGTVYLVSDSSREGESLAMKEMMEVEIPTGERSEAVQLFAREAEMLYSLSHPGLPWIFDFFSLEDSHYIVMEYIEGETLEERMKSHPGPCSWEEVLTWAEEICTILDYLHGRTPHPVIFRDLKPSNIMITVEGRIKLIDFGIARHFNPGKVKDTHCMGTPGFSPPEQYGAGQSDERSDIYALGATLYYLLTKADMIQYSKRFTPLCTISPTVPHWFEEAIMKCLSVNPGERYQSVRMLEKDLLMRIAGSNQGRLPAAMVHHLMMRSLSALAASSLKAVTAVTIMTFIMTAAFGIRYCYLFDGILFYCALKGVILICFIFSAITCLIYNRVIWLRKYLLIPLIITLLLGASMASNFMRARGDGLLTACTSNLKNIGTAMEMYAHDNRGFYPRKLDDLTPQYLKTLPSCPVADKLTYHYVSVTEPVPCYTVYCRGKYHTPFHGTDMPEYDAVQGLYEK
ncbi:MAG: serine/threonine protein kinase [Candidatus Xenobiia bacterium LiM19]